MIKLIDLFLIALLGIIVYQDFRYRLISWILLPLIFMALITRESHVSIEDIGMAFLVNISIMFLQLLILTIYFSIKNKRFINIVNTYLGLGDILFIVTICAAFSPVNLFIFYTLSLVVTIVTFSVYSFFKRGSSEIPLAGAMALLMIPLIILSCIDTFNLYTDLISF